MAQITEIVANLRPEVGQHCWRVTLFTEKEPLETPQEIVVSTKEVEEESLQKVVYGLDQMYIEENWSEDDSDDMIELIPNPECEILKEPKIQQKMTNYFSPLSEK